MTNKVVTITLNPALDLTGSLDVLNQGSVSLVNSSNLHAAGKGVNVAKVLSDLGAQVTVTGFLGADNPEMFQYLFGTIGATDRFVQVKGATRINVKLVESNGTVSDINFPGITVNESDIAVFESVLEELSQNHDYFVFAGSLPNGLSPERCAKWIKTLNTKGKKVLFDSSRDALKVGLDASPWLIKPNDEELSQLLNTPVNNEADCQSAAKQLADKDIDNIVISMGAKGVMWLHDNEWYTATPPKMDVVSTVGAGDTLVAGLCWGHMQAMEKSNLLSFATALSALAVTQVGVGVNNINQVENLQNKINIRRLS
ncbi:1-phosphofructokinase [Vibrio sp. TRT 21S02]|uniref:1-phosphofructokinase n=1 Tax=Vibrio sp. TRT 21S02 TaxID=3418507 RepID=UPI003CEA15EE